MFPGGTARWRRTCCAQCCRCFSRTRKRRGRRCTPRSAGRRWSCPALQARRAGSMKLASNAMRVRMPLADGRCRCSRATGVGSRGRVASRSPLRRRRHGGPRILTLAGAWRRRSTACAVRATRVLVTVQAARRGCSGCASTADTRWRSARCTPVCRRVPATVRIRPATAAGWTRYRPRCCRWYRMPPTRRWRRIVRWPRPWLRLQRHGASTGPARLT